MDKNINSMEPGAVPAVEGASPTAQAATPKDRNANEVSAATVARMMGLATGQEVSLLEGKIDLLTTKLNALSVKLEKLFALSSGFPTGSDLERIDVQIGALRNLIRDTLAGVPSEDSESAEESAPPAAGEGAPQGAASPASDAGAGANKAPKRRSPFVKANEATETK